MINKIKIIHDKMCSAGFNIHYKCRDCGYLHFDEFQILLYDVDFQMNVLNIIL